MVCLPKIQFLAKRFVWKTVGVKIMVVKHWVVIALEMP